MTAQPKYHHKILIVEENSSEREEMAKSLEERGYEILKTEEGNAALSLIKTNQINIVITGGMIPEKDGIELCRRIKAYDAGSYIYIIMLAAKGQKTNQMQGVEAGVDAYIDKPPDMDELEAFIKVGMRISGYDQVVMEIAKQGAESPETAIPGNMNERSSNHHLDIKLQKEPVSMGTISRQDQVLAKIAVTNKLIDKKHLAEAFSIQQKAKEKGKNLSLDIILFQKQWISKEVLNDLRIAAKRQLGKRFGSIAVKKGYVTQEQVSTALKDQAEEYKNAQKCRRLGDILVANGAMTETQRNEILLEQKNIEIKSKARNVAKMEPEKPDTRGEGRPIETMAEDAFDQSEAHRVQSQSSIEQEQYEFDEIAKMFGITVSEDKLEAVIQARDPNLPSSISVDDIKEILKLEGIINGIVDDAVISAFLVKDVAMQKPLVVAKGIKPISGKEPYIKYYFNRDYLTAGKIKEDGEIDYRERGEIPRVKAGDLVAEKIPLEKGTDGVDVFGSPVYVPEVEDVKLRCEDGTTLSEDGLKVYAKIEGQPHATVGGKISVFASFDVNGDVDYKTGNIEFEGNINVKGTVKDGFSVKGGSLTAEEILGARIHVKGDVVVKGGIMGAMIEAEGQVVAKFIKEANIRAYGNVIADKEVLDSKIRTSGEFVTERGRVMSSLVAAKKGIVAKEIGTDVSEPCTIKVGADEHIRKIVQGFDRSRDKVKDTLEKAQADYNTLLEEQVKMQEETMDAVQVQDNAAKEQRVLKDKSEVLKKESRSEELAQLEKKLEDITKKIESMETDINKKFSEQEELEERIEEAKLKIEEIIESIEDISDQKHEVVKWSKKDKSHPRIIVRGSIFAGTKVAGVHTSTVLKETIKNVVIEEIKVPDSEDMYEMNIEKPK